MTGWLAKQRARIKPPRQRQMTNLLRQFEADMGHARQWVFADNGVLLQTWAAIPADDDPAPGAPGAPAPLHPAYVGYVIQRIDDQSVLLRWQLRADQRTNAKIERELCLFDVTGIKLWAPSADTEGVVKWLEIQPPETRDVERFLDRPSVSSRETQQLLGQGRERESQVEIELSFSDGQVVRRMMATP